MHLRKFPIAGLFTFIFILFISSTAFADAIPNKAFLKWLRKEIQKNEVPGVSIAVIHDYKIAWAMGFGVANLKSESSVTDQTMFQAASLSKPVTAMAALKTVQDGKLSLDEDINSSLTSWQVPDNQYTTTEKVTLARLLSHSAGINIPGFIGYTEDEQVPTLSEILQGAAPARTPPIQVVEIPGDQFTYSGGGYTIVQQLLEDVYKKPFPKVMDDLVLMPLGMSRSTFQQPLPSDLTDQIALPYHPGYESVKGGPHIYPEEAAAGLWTTPFDLAKFIISLQASLRGQPNQILNPEYAKDMISRQVDHMGLGFMVNMNKYGKPAAKGRYFMHRGLNEGYRNLIIASVTGGNGIIIMTNMTPDSHDIESGKIKDNWAFIDAIEQKIADEEYWK